MNKRNRIVIFGFVLITILIGIFGCSSKPKLIYNEIESIYEPAPKWYPESFDKDLTNNEVSEIISIDVTKCLPKSLSNFNQVFRAFYINEKELGCISIGFSDPEKEPLFGKCLILSIANKKWSENSNLGVDYIYSEIKQKSYAKNGISIDAFVRPSKVFENSSTGFREERQAVYIASFVIDSFEFYVEGREGVTENEFEGFIEEIIENFERI